MWRFGLRIDRHSFGPRTPARASIGRATQRRFFPITNATRIRIGFARKDMKGGDRDGAFGGCRMPSD